MRLGNYQLIDQLYESSLSRVHRGRRSDGLEVIIKTPAPKVSAREFDTRARHELLVCRMCDSPNVISALELVREGGAAGLVFESIPEATTLKQRGRQRQLGVEEALRIALGVLDALASLHARNIVHKDVKPDNILVTSDLARVVLIDLGIATIVPRDAATSPATKLEGSLHFMPPEQTGRVNRAVDYRSDYYALGATLHWMLVGEAPFASLSETQQLVHAHIALAPVLLSERDPSIPPALARLVAKLLSKSADDRYQSSYGLRADLERCLELCRAHSPEARAALDFELASVDRSEVLTLPQRLYGRAEERARLAGLFLELDEGPLLQLVRGPTGVGKSALVDSFCRSLGAQVLFARGAYSQPAHADPYGGVGQALRALIEQLASEAQTRREVMTRIYARVGTNVSLLFDLFPELAQLLGVPYESQAQGRALAEQGTPEREHVWDTLDGVVDALLLPERDYVLFIDELQAADEASLRLLARIVEQPERRLLVLAAMRDPELDSASSRSPRGPGPLDSALARMRQREDIRLEPLGPAALRSMVCDALPGAERAPELAALIHERTRGVPLYVSQLLYAMYVDGALELERRSGSWRVDLERARALELSLDSAEFLALRFARLEPPAQRCLAIAACVGLQFELDLLVALAGDPRELERGLAQALSLGYVASVDPPARERDSAQLCYRFPHEHLRRVALRQLGARERAELHLAIARKLDPQHLPARDLQPRLLGRLAEHIHRARERVEDDDERVRFASLCRAAAERARRAGAHELAIGQLETASELLEAAARSRWHPRALLLEVCFELGESQYLSGALEDARQAFARARALVETRAERVRLLLPLARLVLARGEAGQALALALEAAAAFGFKLDLDAPSGERITRLAALHARLDELGPEALVAEPALEDEELRSLVGLLQTVTHSLSLSRDARRVEVLLCLCMELSLEHGVSASTGLCLVQLAAIEIMQGGDDELARRYAGAGLALVERFDDLRARAEAHMLYGATLHPWFEPLASSLAPLDSAQRQLRSSGSGALALLAESTRILHAFLVGAPLDKVMEDCDAATAYASLQAQAHTQARRPSASTDALLAGLHVAAAVLGDEQPRAADVELELSEAELDADRAPGSAFVGHGCCALACVLLGWRDQAAQHIEAGYALRAYARSPLVELVFEFVAALDACMRYGNASEDQQMRLVARIDAGMTALARWRLSSPVNAAPYAHLVAGAWAHARGQLDAAVEAFTLAADAAQASGVCSLEAYANERAASILLAQGKRRAAVGYFDEAYQAYARWGALALQRRIDEALRRGRGKAVNIATLESVTMNALDLSGALELAQLMFDADTLEQVIDRLLHAVNECAGATRCILLLDEHSELRVRAERRATGELYLLDRGLSVGGEQLALSLVRACVNGRAAVIVDDAARDPRHAVDPYVLSHGLRALLAVPLLRQSQRVGILYLENDMTPGAFTPDHVALLSTFAAQAAISLDNARLLDALRERDAQWRAVASNSPNILLLVNRQRRVEYMNREAYGITPDLLIGEPATVMVTQSDRHLLEQAIDHVFESGRPSACEARIQTPDASGVRHWQIRVGPIIREQVVERVTLIATDNTDRLTLEQQLQHSQKLQAVGTLAGGVAHDFNNLLTVIMGAREIAQLNSADPTVLDMLGEIDTAANQAASLTQQLLAFSRKQVLQPRRFDLRELVADLSRLFKRVLGEPIELLISPGPRACMIHADRSQISQVLVNLAVNARDAMVDGGTLTIATRVAVYALPLAPAEPDAEPPGEELLREVVLEVTDTGHGMESEVLERIFEPFFTTKPEGKGTGLGMATVLGIVNQCEGSIEVHSAPGEGTSFYVSLPFAEGPSSELDEQPSSELPRGDERVLLVEDELAVRRVAVHMLELQGYEVLVAANGDQALALALEHAPIDLLISDVVMPGKSGPELAAELLRLRPEARVLYTSGYTDDAVMRHGVLDGSTDYLPKPFTRESLARAVREVLDSAEGPPA